MRGESSGRHTVSYRERADIDIYRDIYRERYIYIDRDTERESE